jgi:hypothetical protein
MMRGQAVTRGGEPLQLQKPMQIQADANSIMGRHFRPHHTKWRAIAGPRALDGSCDDEGVPLICPTCQMSFSG